MSNIDKQALRKAAEKATVLNLDTAQEARQEDDECIECPTCGGDGYMEVQRDYCNIDGVALGVLFYGIGEHHGLAEAFFRAANPAAVLSLLDEQEAKGKRIAELEVREVTLPRPACTYADHSYPAYSERQVVALLESLGIRINREGE
ncbi:TPA: ead/Ea22-like family protein [Enterobacter chengduensis]|nr:ead/Ea22-like family protein [Enterobacter chengduensis]